MNTSRKYVLKLDIRRNHNKMGRRMEMWYGQDPHSWIDDSQMGG